MRDLETFKTLADMTAEERADCVGMWCEYKDGNGTKLAVIVETWLTDPEACMAYDISCHENRHPLGGDVTPRPDLPRAWNPDGTPPAWKWEHAHIPALGEFTRRFVGEWEEA